MARAGRLIIMANRLPVSRAPDGKSWRRSPGGLVTAVDPIVQRRGGVWIGWTGGAGRAPAPFVQDKLRFRPVALSDREIIAYYGGFCNRTLWPLYHDAIRAPEFERSWWAPYVDVNERFASAAAREAGRGDIVWVHDFHLQLVPALLRELRPDLKIGFFLHIPFPPEELFLWLPWREAIVKGMLGADVIGFQTQWDAQNFSRLARRLDLAQGTDTELKAGGRTVRAGSFPISIDFSGYDGLARQEKVKREAARIQQMVGENRKILLCVDRLDYTKGIEHRLRAFEQLLKWRAASVKNCVMIQIAVPSRESLPDYAETRLKVEQTVGRINGEFSEPGKVAVHYFRRSFPAQDLAAYYAAAHAMVVTPLRDGMNLVAKEFVATRTDNSGVLVLSEFAGAARQLRRAILVNPRDVDAMAGAMAAALRMNDEEGRQRMAVLRMVVRRHDVFEWADEFLKALR